MINGNKIVQCPKCKGEGEVFSGLYGHPETSDGGPMMYRCYECEGSGKVTEEKYYKIKNNRVL